MHHQPSHIPRIPYMQRPKSSINSHPHNPFLSPNATQNTTTVNSIMAKLTILAASLAVFLVIIANTSAYRTTITTVEIDEDDSRQSKCRAQVQMQDLNQCEQFLKRAIQGQGYLTLERDSNRSGQPHLQQCCQQLRQLDDKCQCEGIFEVVREQQGELEGQEMQKMLQAASNLPAMCGLRARRCKIKSSEWF